MKPAPLARAGNNRAFTFVEVFAALIFLAILVPAIVEGLSIANKASVVAERGAIAGELAENKLNEIILSSTSSATTSTSADTRGDFGDDWPGYTWEATQGTWNQDNLNTMKQLSVEVFFPVQGGQRSVTLATLVSGSSQNATP